MSELAEYERKIVNNLGYFAMSRTRVGSTEMVQSGGGLNCKKYHLESTSFVAQLMYWLFYANSLIKLIFLAFLINEYFGPVEFLDKIAALDYILCVGIVTFGSCIWFLRYPLYEVLHSFWKTENDIFKSLGFPKELKQLVEKRQHDTVWIHLCIVWFGCSVLVTQFYADPKYCGWTYSTLTADLWYLRIVFVAHEFIFIMHGWNNMTGSASLCTFQGIVLSNLIDRMTEVLENFHLKDKLKCFPAGCKIAKVTAQKQVDLLSTSSSILPPSKPTYDSVKQLIVHYKQLMLISEQFNSWVSYKIVFLHVCGYCQFISDVFVAMQVLKEPGAGIWDVWFYLEDSLASMYMIYRLYKFMSRVKPSSIRFLNSLATHLTVNTHEKRKLRKVARTLRPVSLKLGPCPVTPITVLKALDMLGNYYVCVALWN